MNRLLLIILALFLAGCSGGHRHHHHRTTQVKKVHHLVDGRYAYQDDTGLWWLYMYHISNTGSPSAIYTSGTRSYVYYINAVTTAPSPLGGAWVSVKSINLNPEQEEQLELELNDSKNIEIEEPVEVSQSGEPIDAQTEEQMEFDFGEVGDNDSGSVDSSDSGDSGSGDSGSDSGGGGDGGGGGDSSSSDSSPSDTSSPSE